MTRDPDTSPLAGVFAPLGRGATYSRLLFLVSAMPLGIALTVVLAVGWSLGLGLVVTVVGIPLIVGLLWACGWLVEADRRFMNATLDAGVASLRGRRRSGIRGVVADAATWREQAYLFTRALAGTVIGTVAVAVVGTGLQLLSIPIWYRWAESSNFGIEVDTLPVALGMAAAGVVVLVVAAHLMAPLGRLWGAIARGILVAHARDAAGGPGAAADGSADAVVADPVERRRRWRRGVALHAAVWALVAAVTVSVWALTTPGGYPWFAWVWLGTALPLGVHAWVVLHPGAGRSPARSALEVHAGVMGILALFILAIWLLTMPGRYPWFLWVWLGLAVPPALHLVVYWLRPGERAALAERVEVLTTTRAGAVDAQAAELQRIERDLHDGAQARLVALAMDLGRAEAQMDRDPETARRIMNEAREQARRALTELRDLARGIYPPVLADRGLTAAVVALAARGPLEVSVSGELEGRPAAAVEAAAYFVVAESLTNAAKHSGADRAEVRIRREGDLLCVEVTDAGAGGADPDGAGLTGLRRRVEALDGTLRVASPVGGPTLVRAELPWGRRDDADA